MAFYLKVTKENLIKEAYEANMHLRYGYMNTLLGEMEIALNSFNKALNLQISIGYKRGEAISNFLIGRTYYFWGKSQKGLDLLNESLSLIKKNRLPIHFIRCRLR